MLSGEALLAPFALAPEMPLVVGVSGGVDSMVLLTLLAKTTHPVIAAQFDHQLRPSSAAEAEMVAAYAQGLGVKCVRGQWPLAAHPQSDLEAAARTARYQFLSGVARQVHTPYLVVAQHADDQLETVLLQLLRSGNVLKMAGMAPNHNLAELQVLRPLLGVPKAALYAFAKAEGVPFAEDETNRDVTLSRNRLRQQVTPVLKALNPQILAHTARFSDGLQGLIALAEPVIQQLVTQAVTGVQAQWGPLTKTPLPVQRLVLEAILTQWRVQAAPNTVTAVLSALQAGAGSKAYSLSRGELIVSYQTLRWQSQPTVPPTMPPIKLALGQWQTLPDGTRIGTFTQRPAEAAQWLWVPSGEVLIRERLPGDRVRLASGHHKLLRRWLIDHKVPQAQRARIVVAACGQTVYWVAGMPERELFQGQRTDIMQAVLALQPPIQ
ncbi:MAG: tRNA lysidine(34) synthetase TilS [Lactobacillus sp.]|jgi:tRNA(Ile)-lysidine synthase|nr:tRNA lysidine(34) synthetase TilS [Lactobacillus sp.]MCI2034051.1 tRNA lysidine(34) synthetase TilS [Lactobacillus sp.]